MTPAKLQELAREAVGLTADYPGRVIFECDSAGLARFAALVRAAVLEEAARRCEEIGDAFQERESGLWPELKSDAQTGARALAQQAGGKD